jgi:hypothetical protein
LGSPGIFGPNSIPNQSTGVFGFDDDGGDAAGLEDFFEFVKLEFARRAIGFLHLK